MKNEKPNGRPFTEDGQLVGDGVAADGARIVTGVATPQVLQHQVAAVLETTPGRAAFVSYFKIVCLFICFASSTVFVPVPVFWLDLHGCTGFNRVLPSFYWNDNQMLSYSFAAVQEFYSCNYCFLDLIEFDKVYLRFPQSSVLPSFTGLLLERPNWC